MDNAASRMLSATPPTLTPAGFAAAVAASYGVAPAKVAAVLDGAASTSTLKIRPAEAVVKFLIGRDLDAAVHAARGDGRTKVGALISHAQGRRAAEAAAAAAKSKVWTVDEIVDELVERERAGRALAWPTAPSAQGTPMAAPAEFLVPALFRFVGQRSERLAGLDLADPETVGVVAEAVAPLVAKLPSRQVSMLWTDPVAATAQLQARAIVAALWLARSSATREQIEEMPVCLASATVQVLDVLPDSDAWFGPVGSPAGGAAPVRARSALAAKFAFLGQLHGPGSVADVFGVASLAELGDSELSMLVSDLRGSISTSELGVWRDVLAAVLVAAVDGRSTRRTIGLQVIPADVVAAMTPEAFFSYCAPNRQGQAGQHATWMTPALKALASGAWDEAGFRAAAQRFEAVVSSCTEILLTYASRGEPRVADMPRFVIEWSQRTDGLASWLNRDQATIVELAAAGSQLTLEQWATVWSLSERFSGTVDELVDVASQAAP